MYPSNIFIYIYIYIWGFVLFVDPSSSGKVSSSRARGSIYFVDFKIFFEPLVGSSTFVELIEFLDPSILWTTYNFYPLGGPSIL